MPTTILTDLTKMSTEELMLALSDIVYGRTEEDPETASLYEIVDELESRLCTEGVLRVHPAAKTQ